MDDRAATAPHAALWPPTDTRYRRYERVSRIGTGAHTWERARRDVLMWAVKTRSGFAVHPLRPVAIGDRPAITAGAWRVTVREPVEVIAVVDEPGRAGFAYRALPGHPVRGEEAFVVERRGDDVVLILRSLTRPAASGPWRAAYPLLRTAQALARFRYRRALRSSVFTVRTRTRIPADALFAASVDIDAHVDSMAHSRERAVAGVTTGRIGPGESVTWRARHFGVWFTMTSRITEWDAPRRFVDEQVRGPFRVFRHEHRFETDAEGTLMTDVISVSSPVFGRLAERLVLVPYLRRLIAQRNRHLLSVLRTSVG
jgi:uncharacterized protein (UPF0548 family)/ligand-binding SRPBCC domain-containing protein